MIDNCMVILELLIFIIKNNLLKIFLIEQLYGELIKQVLSLQILVIGEIH